jgi:type IV secretory pathway VirJ component
MSDINIPKIKEAVFIAPAQKATFEVALTDYIYVGNVGKDILPEFKKLKTKNAFCICDDESNSICKQNLNGIIEYTVLKGGHHFDGDFTVLCKLIGKHIGLE